jgi:hypothetical protein
MLLTQLLLLLLLQGNCGKVTGVMVVVMVVIGVCAEEVGVVVAAVVVVAVVNKDRSLVCLCTGQDIDK